MVLGAKNDTSRVNIAEALLNYGFRFYRAHLLFSANTSIVTPHVWKAKNGTVKLGVKDNLYVTVPINQDNVKATVKVNKPLVAPIVLGQSYGTIDVTVNGQPLASYPLTALEADEKGGWWRRLIDSILMFFKRS